MKVNSEISPFKVLVTGGTGFIGQHLLYKLVALGCDVHAIKRKDFQEKSYTSINDTTWHFFDGTTLSLISILQKTKPDLVIHLASLFLSQHSNQNLDDLIHSNVLFGTQLLEAMDMANVRLFLNAGTSWQNFQNEAYSPVNLYAATKQAFEDICLYYCQAKNMSMLTLRIFDTYGINDPRPKLMPTLQRASMTGERLDLSPGDQLIDLVYIDDVIDCFVLATQRLLNGLVAGPEVYALSSLTPVRLKELVQLYASISNRNLNIQWGVRPYRDREVMIPWNSGPTLPGWVPKVDLPTGLKLLTQY
jgi:nucleoside-diphosphate-sugar epimerase